MLEKKSVIYTECKQGVGNTRLIIYVRHYRGKLNKLENKYLQ